MNLEMSGQCSNILHKTMCSHLNIMLLVAYSHLSVSLLNDANHNTGVF
jgi:hypothetical protein